MQFLERLREACRDARETLDTIPAYDAAPLLVDIEALEQRIDEELGQLLAERQPDGP